MRNHSVYLILIAALLALILMPVNTVLAATLTVNQTGTQTDSGDGDSTCSLIDAIQVANGSATDSDCGAGDAGSDTIVLSGGATYSLASANDLTDGSSGLPSITSTIIIEGNGAIINRTGVSNYRIFHISAGGNLTLNDTQVSSGSSTSPGGGIYSLGTLTIDRSTIASNVSTGNGGGIYVGSGNLAITNSTVSSNTGASGGGIYANGGTVNVNAATIANNSNGIVQSAGTVNVQSSILDNSTNCGGTVNNGGNNLSSDATCSGFGATSSGALSLGGLNFNLPGLTQTHMPGAGSSAIDAASSCATTSDQRGVGRPVGANCDIGSVETGTPGFTIDEGGGVAVDEEGTTSDSYVVTVDTPPTSDVIFNMNIPDPQCQITSPNPVTVSPATIGFTVNVQAIDDSVNESSPHTCIITHSASSSDPLYNNILIADVNVNVTDNDTPAVNITPTTVDISEDGATDTYSIVLATQPTGNVDITIDADPQQCFVDTPTHTFNASNWDTPINVMVTAVNDLFDEGTHTCVITHTPGGSDLDYTNLILADVTATITDNDTAGVDVTPTTIALAEGGPSQTYNLTLDTPSAASVFIDFLTPSGECTILSANPLEIFPNNTGPFIVQVQAVDDMVADNNNCIINHVASSSDTAYDGIFIPDVTATIADNDTPGLAYNPNPRSITEGGPGQDYLIFLNTLPSADVQINIATDAQCTITAGNPATILNGTLGPATVTVQAVDDGAFEASPHICAITHTTSSSDANYNNIVDTNFSAQVTDNDAPTISINDPPAVAENTGLITFTVSLSAISAQTITVDWATADNTATAADSDYVTTSGTVTFAPGDTNEPVTVTVNGDTQFENPETFFVNLTNPTNATIADPQGIGTINNDDAQPEISIDSPPAVAEGNSGQTPITFTVSLTNASSQSITVTWQTADDMAAAGSDYDAGGPTVLTFAPGGSLTQTVTVQVNGDTTDEPNNETFFVNLSSATNATIDIGTGIGTITDDDPPPSISIDSPATPEGDTPPPTDLTFTVTLSNPSSQSVTVDWTTADDTATTADSDYNAVTIPQTLTFAPGIVTQTLTVQIVGDTTPESDETFFVNLANPTNATIGTGQGTGTILDDDTAPLPTLSIDSPPAVVEGTGATVDITFTVTLSAASAQTVTLNWSAADDTAVSGSDYTTAPTLITFNPGDLTQTFTVQVVGDTLDEATETFFVNLATPTNATINVGQGTGTITDDDAAPTISIDDQPGAEGSTVTLNVTLSAASGQAVTVNWTTADDAAVAGSDYVAVTTPTLITFIPGVTAQTLDVTTNTDTIHEQPDETFFVNLATPTNATILDGQGIGTITDNDAQPSIRIFDAPAVAEGSAPAMTPAVFTLNLSNASSQTITVEWTTADGSATTADSDYVGVTVPAGLVTFAPNTTTQTLSVAVNGDTAVEVDENFTVNLSTPSNATIAIGTAAGIITNDDALPTLSIGPAAVTEGAPLATINANFTVTLSAASAQTVTVDWTTADGSATTADSDYVGTTGTLTFIPNDTSETIPVTVNGDAAVEPDENFTVTLSAPTNATIAVGQGTGTGTITNDDVLPTLSISDVTVTEGNSGQVAATFSVSLSAAYPQIVTVNWATADGSATTVNSDYVANSGTVTFPANTTTAQTVTVQVNGDTAVEPNENFTVNLNTPVNATILDGQGMGTITNDDVTVSISDVTVTEGNSGQVAANFSVTISAATPQVVTVNWTTADVSATTINSDYVAASGTVTFPANTTAAQTVTVQVNGDTAVEPNETFTVILSTPVNATILDNQGVGTITNDDGSVLPNLRIGDRTVTEGNSGQVAAIFSVTISSATPQIVTVNWATANGTATTANSDYAAASGTLTFPANSTAAQTLTVQVNGDTVVEGNEIFNVNLSAPTNATITDGLGVGTITNDDGTGTPTIRISDASVNEGNSGTTAIEFTITRSGSLTGSSNVTATTADSMATLGNNDYVGRSQTFTFLATEDEKTFTVQVVGDSTTEPNEEFLVNLSGVSGATISDNQGIGTILNDDGTTPGTTPTATPIPAVPPAPLCADLNGTTNPIIRAQVPAGTVTNGNVFCRILAQNGQFVGGSPPETVGNPQVLSLGVVHAVDVYALSGGSPIIAFNNSVNICLQGTGSMVYMDATQAPRPPVILTSATSDGTYTCANIPNAGTVILVQSGGNLPGVNTGGGGSGGPSQSLSGCVVTPLMRLNLRSVPGLDGRVLTIVPEGIALGSSQRTRRWFRVAFEGRTGWIFAAYVSTNGACGE